MRGPVAIGHGAPRRYAVAGGPAGLGRPRPRLGRLPPQPQRRRERAVKVPEAFRTAPRVPPRDGRYPCSECGSRTWMAYRSGETRRGTKGVMPAPIRWCMYCKGLRHWSGRTVDEQKAWANHYSCMTCSSSTYRLRLWVSDGLTLTLPYAYCITCDAVASRPIETRGERKQDGVKKCAGCNASISDRYKWCSNCKLRQIYGHGRLGPPQRRVRAEEAHVRRKCVECKAEYLPNSGTQRFCTECAAARLRTSRRKPTPKKKPVDELEVAIDFSAVADADAGAGAAEPAAGGGRGVLSLMAIDGGRGNGTARAPPAALGEAPVFDASLPFSLCRPVEFAQAFPPPARGAADAAAPPARRRAGRAPGRGGADLDAPRLTSYFPTPPPASAPSAGAGPNDEPLPAAAAAAPRRGRRPAAAASSAAPATASAAPRRGRRPAAAASSAAPATASAAPRRGRRPAAAASSAASPPAAKRAARKPAAKKPAAKKPAAKKPARPAAGRRPAS